MTVGDGEPRKISAHGGASGLELILFRLDDLDRKLSHVVTKEVFELERRDMVKRVDSLEDRNCQQIKDRRRLYIGLALALAAPSVTTVISALANGWTP